MKQCEEEASDPWRMNQRRGIKYVMQLLTVARLALTVKNALRYCRETGYGKRESKGFIKFNKEGSSQTLIRFF